MASLDEDASCVICDRDQDLVETLVSIRDEHICNECTHLSLMEISSHKSKTHSRLDVDLVKPKDLKAQLDNYIIGQEKAKKTIAVAVYNHFKRIRSIRDGKSKYRKSNIVIFGPTGTGKTLLVKTVADILKIPVALTDATTLTQAGFVGEDVEGILLTLFKNANHDISLAQKGIIYIDEIDKIRKTTGNVSITRDVSGEGVQQALLKMVEGTISNIQVSGGRKHPNGNFMEICTEHILFVVGGAFVGLEEIIAKRLGSMSRDMATNELLDLTKPEDLVKFGLIPELVGRFSSFAHCNTFSIENLVDILSKPKNSIIKEYQSLFREDKVDLIFTEDALKAIAIKADESGTGARGLRMIVEELLMDLMYEIPSDPSVNQVLVGKEAVLNNKPPVISRSIKKT